MIFNTYRVIMACPYIIWIELNLVSFSICPQTQRTPVRSYTRPPICCQF